MAEKQEYKILHRREIHGRTLDGVEHITLAVTYQAPGKPPYTIFIPKSGYSEKVERLKILQHLKSR